MQQTWNYLTGEENKEKRQKPENCSRKKELTHQQKSQGEQNCQAGMHG